MSDKNKTSENPKSKNKKKIENANFTQKNS